MSAIRMSAALIVVVPVLGPTVPQYQRVRVTSSERCNPSATVGESRVCTLRHARLALQAVRSRVGDANLTIQALRRQPEYDTVLASAAHVADDRLLQVSCAGSNSSLSHLDRAAQCLLRSFLEWPPCPTTNLPQVDFDASPVEFGYEVFQFVPEAYALCKLGALNLRTYCEGSVALYHFAGAMLHDAKSVVCSRNVRAGAAGSVPQDFHRQHRRPVGDFWNRQPTFQSTFRLLGRHHGRIAFVFNKMNDLGTASGLLNSWMPKDLIYLLERLKRCFDAVVYFRAGASNVSLLAKQMGDSMSLDGHDVEAIHQQLPSVFLLQDLIPDGPAYLDRLNIAQLILAASAHVTVGTQGGGALLASLAANPFYLICRTGIECHNDIGFWSRYNNATIVAGASGTVLATLATQGCPPAGGGALHLDVNNRKQIEVSRP